MKQPRFSLTVAILSSLTMVLIITWFLLGIISFKTAEKYLYAQKADEGRRLLTTFISLLPSDLAQTPSSSAVAQFVGSLAQEQAFESITIINPQGSVIYSAPPGTAGDERLGDSLQRGASVSFSANRDHLSRYEVIATDGTVRGAARLTLSLGTEHERLHEFQRIYLAYFGLDFLLLLGLGSFLLSRLIVVPVRKLLTATQHIGAGDLSYRVPVSGTVETVGLARSFNSMTESLTRQRAEIEDHVASLESTNTELKQAREESIRSEKMASVGLLAAGMAHEVGTPLSAIIGYAAILHEELRGDPERLEYVQRIEDESRRIDHIVRHLLDYARPSTGEYEQVAVSELIQGAYELLNAQGIFKKFKVTIELPDNLPEIRVDGHQLQQVLINLMINARDAMPSGGELHVTASRDVFIVPHTLTPPESAVFRGRRKSDFHGAFQSSLRSGDRPLPCLKIQVRDTGEGIPQENIEKLFDPFFTTKEPGKGTGLGLAICARIIDSFNGRITVQSTVGAGAIFCIWLPVESE